MIKPSQILPLLKTLSENDQAQMRKQARFVFDNFFATMEKNMEALFSNFKERITPDDPSKPEYWNGNRMTQQNPINQLDMANDNGFTAVILTYNRLDSLWRVVSKISKVKSCRLILIVWQDQERLRPQIDDWPEFTTPVIFKTPSREYR